MAKFKPVVKMQTYGIHSQWQSKAKDLPTIQEFTTQIPAEVDIEFGFIVNIKKARGAKIQFCIDHPGVLDVNGNKRAAFTGDVHVTNNDWDFYLGDTVWLPIADKCGDWRMNISLDNKVLAEKTFHVYRAEQANH